MTPAAAVSRDRGGWRSVSLVACRLNLCAGKGWGLRDSHSLAPAPPCSSVSPGPPQQLSPTPRHPGSLSPSPAPLGLSPPQALLAECLGVLLFQLLAGSLGPGPVETATAFAAISESSPAVPWGPIAASHPVWARPPFLRPLATPASYLARVPVIPTPTRAYIHDATR